MPIFPGVFEIIRVFYIKNLNSKYDNSSCEWNNFLKDFCADEKNWGFNNKLKVASILWNLVRNSEQPKKYSPELVEKYWDLLREYYQ